MMEVSRDEGRENKQVFLKEREGEGEGYEITNCVGVKEEEDSAQHIITVFYS